MKRSARTGQPRHLRDAAELCLAVLGKPAYGLVCELPVGHLDAGQKHKSGCTSWGRPNQTTA